MEKLVRIHLSGFRSIRELDLELRDLTVLIGANGSGKSNLVRFFDMVSYLLSGDLQLFVARAGGGSSLLHYGPKETPALHASLEFDNDGTRSEYRFSLSFAAPDRLIFTDEHVEFQRPGEPAPFEKTLGVGQTEAHLGAAANADIASVERTVARVFMNRLRGMQSYHFHDTSENSRIRMNQDVARNRHLMSHGGNLASFLYMLRSAHPRHFERIEATCRSVVPYFREFVLAPNSENPGTIRLRWRDNNPDYEFGPEHLSDGSLRAMAIVTALLQPEELLPSVVIMDEPELGLHPSGVRLIAQLLRSVATKRQVLIATQSPRLLSEFAPDEVVVAERYEESTGLGESTFRRLVPEDLEAWLDEYDLGTLFEMNVTGGGPQ